MRSLSERPEESLVNQLSPELKRASSFVDKDENSNKGMQGADTPAANNMPAWLWKRLTAGDKAVKV